MTNAWALSALRAGPAPIATLMAICLKVSTALSEIMVGTVAQLILVFMKTKLDRTRSVGYGTRIAR